MANVRDYFKNKGQRGDKPKGISYREKIKSHKFMIGYRIALVLCLAAAVAAALAVQWKNKIYTEAAVLSSIEISIPKSGNIIPFADSILIYSKDGASCLDSKGSTVWNETFEMQNPMIDICRNVAAIGDYNGRDIYIMDTAGILGKIVTNKPIRSFRVAANGVVEAVLDDSGLTWIYLYDTDGNELAYLRTSMKESGYPFSVAVSPNGKLLGVSYLFADSGEIKARVAFFNFGLVGQNYTYNFVNGYDYLNSVVGYTRFLDDKAFFAVADDRIMFFSGSEIPVSTAERLFSEEVHCVYYGRDYVGLVFLGTDGVNRYRMDVYNKSGQIIRTLKFDMEYRDIVFANEQIIIYNESECRIYDMEGVEKYAGRFEKNVKLLVPGAAPYRYTLVTETSIDTIELK